MFLPPSERIAIGSEVVVIGSERIVIGSERIRIGSEAPAERNGPTHPTIQNR